jgi:hypothetical protein
MALEYKAIIRPNGAISTEVTYNEGNCSEVERIVTRLGQVTDHERTGEDCPTVHETTST